MEFTFNITEEEFNVLASAAFDACLESNDEVLHNEVIKVIEKRSSNLFDETLRYFDYAQIKETNRSICRKFLRVVKDEREFRGLD